MLEESVDAIDALGEQHERHEDRYWYRYIHAHRALASNDSDEFVRQVYGLWFEGVAPLESSFEAVSEVSLDRIGSTGFVSALPYLYESVARLVLIRSLESGVERGLDPLASVVRMLADDRIGAHPRVVPEALSSKAFLDRIMARLDGPASDGGRLSFTLALFEAARLHEASRSALASEGFTAETIESIARASGSYERAYDQAKTALGRSAVYVSALRQLGEIHAAKQRLGVDPSVRLPFHVEGAIEIYDELSAARDDDEWMDLGFRNTAADAYVETLHDLWAEIQEASMNLADYHLSRSQADPVGKARHLRSAERVYVRYLALFDQYANGKGGFLVPDSATFGVYEAAKGFGDIHMLYSGEDVSPSVAAAVREHYLVGLRAFAFDRDIWASLAGSLETQDRAGEYLGFAHPVANVVEGSRAVGKWIALDRPGSERIHAFQRALADDRALLMLGFTEGDGETRLTDELFAIRARYEELDGRLAEAEAELARLDRVGIAQIDPARAEEPLAKESQGELPSVSAAPEPVAPMSRETVVSRIASTQRELQELDRQLSGFERALPLYAATAVDEDLIQALRAQRDHPAHALLRRLQREMSTE